MREFGEFLHTLDLTPLGGESGVSDENSVDKERQSSLADALIALLVVKDKITPVLNLDSPGLVDQARIAQDQFT